MRCFLLLLTILISSPVFALSNCVDAFSSAVLETNGEHIGLWRYTVTVRYASQEAFGGKVLLGMDLNDCPCICEDYFVQPQAMQAGACTTYYGGIGFCNGNVPVEMPCNAQSAILFIPEPGPCQPPGTGEILVEFWCASEPSTDPPLANNLMVEVGKLFCYGTVSGDLPGCDCGNPTPVDQYSWGRVKALYR